MGRYCALLALLLLVGCPADPAYLVGSAHLRGDRVVVDVQYGIGSARTVGLLLVENSPLLPTKDDVGWTLDPQGLTTPGGRVTVHYGEVLVPPFAQHPASCASVSNLDRNTSAPLTAALLSRIKQGDIACVLVTDGGYSQNPNRPGLTYRPRQIRTR